MLSSMLSSNRGKYPVIIPIGTSKNHPWAMELFQGQLVLYPPAAWQYFIIRSLFYLYNLYGEYTRDLIAVPFIPLLSSNCPNQDDHYPHLTPRHDQHFSWILADYSMIIQHQEYHLITMKPISIPQVSLHFHPFILPSIIITISYQLLI